MKIFIFLLIVLLPSLIIASELPIPGEPAQASALDLIKEVYKTDYEAARTNVQKATLAKKMLQDSAATNDTTNRYVLLRVAKDVAAQAGDVDTAFAATSQLERRYEVDGLMMKAAAVAAASKEAKLPSHHQAIAPYFLQLIDQAVAADRYDLANNIGDVALESARNARSSDIVKDVVAAQKRIEELKAAFAEVQEALAVLKNKPADPAANLVVGKFRCFVKEEWDAGISMLALGSDPNLKAIAVKELADDPDALAVGDGWWDASEKLEESAKTAARRRAAVLYRKALPELDGLAKRKVEVRLDHISRIMEESNLHRAEAMKEHPAQGIWRTPTGNIIQIRADGVIAASGGKQGIWKVVDENTFLVAWDMVFFSEKAVVSDDGQSARVEYRRKPGGPIKRGTWDRFHP